MNRFFLALALALTAPAVADGPSLRVETREVKARDILAKPDATVLEAPNGHKITVGEFRKLVEAERKKQVTLTKIISPELATLGTKLKKELLAANAAALAGYNNYPHSNIPPKSMVPTQLPTPKPGAITTVEGVGWNYQIQPGQLILLNGKFASKTPVDVRIEGQFSPYGYLLLEIQDKGPEFIYGKVPIVTGVPDQAIDMYVRYTDGSTSNKLNGTFRATRTTTDVSDLNRLRQILIVDADVAGRQPDDRPCGFWPFNSACEVFRGGKPEAWHGIDTLRLKAGDKGFRIPQIWVSVDQGSASFGSNGEWPQVHWHTAHYQSTIWLFTVDDGHTSAYGLEKIRIEGPIGVSF